MSRQSVKEHEGNKYIRTIKSCTTPGESTEVDVYEVLIAFNVTDPAIQHCIKKLLCTGIRGKGTFVEDLVGAMAALNRAIDIAEREYNKAAPALTKSQIASEFLRGRKVEIEEHISPGRCDRT